MTSLLQKMADGKQEPEYEIFDTGIFDNDAYFDIFIEYCKADHNDILVRVTVCNRSQQEAPIVVAPQHGSETTGNGDTIPIKRICMLPMTEVLILNTTAFPIKFYSRKDNTQRVFCENETNTPKLYGAPQAEGTYFKDGINNYIIYGSNTVNPEKEVQKLLS